MTITDLIRLVGGGARIWGWEWSCTLIRDRKARQWRSTWGWWLGFHGLWQHTSWLLASWGSDLFLFPWSQNRCWIREWWQGVSVLPVYRGCLLKIWNQARLYAIFIHSWDICLLVWNCFSYLHKYNFLLLLIASDHFWSLRFISASAIIILSSQLKYFLGVTIPRVGEEFVGTPIIIGQ